MKTTNKLTKFGYLSIIFLALGCAEGSNDDKTNVDTQAWDNSCSMSDRVGEFTFDFSMEKFEGCDTADESLSPEVWTDNLLGNNTVRPIACESWEFGDSTCWNWFDTDCIGTHSNGLTRVSGFTTQNEFGGNSFSGVLSLIKGSTCKVQYVWTATRR
jgi:hypothetical protein